MAVKSARKPAAPSANATVAFDRDRIAALAKALGHPARVKVVETLLRRRTCIGCDIVEEIGLAASTTSEHLRILKEAGVIVGEIARPRVCYSLNPAAVADRKSTRLNSSHSCAARMPSSACKKN